LIWTIIFFFAGSAFPLKKPRRKRELGKRGSLDKSDFENIRTEPGVETVNGLLSNGAARTMRLAAGLWGGEHIGHAGW
jgi:hypothetical protein